MRELAAAALPIERFAYGDDDVAADGRIRSGPRAT